MFFYCTFWKFLFVLYFWLMPGAKVFCVQSMLIWDPVGLLFLCSSRLGKLSAVISLYSFPPLFTWSSLAIPQNVDICCFHNILHLKAVLFLLLFFVLITSIEFVLWQSIFWLLPPPLLSPTPLLAFLLVLSPHPFCLSDWYFNILFSFSFSYYFLYLIKSIVSSLNSIFSWSSASASFSPISWCHYNWLNCFFYLTYWVPYNEICVNILFLCWISYSF